MFWRSLVTVIINTGTDNREVRRCSEIRNLKAIVSEQDASWFETFVLDMLVDIRKSIYNATVATMEPAEASS